MACSLTYCPRPASLAGRAGARPDHPISGGSLRTPFSSAFGEDRTWTADQFRSAAPLLTRSGPRSANLARCTTRFPGIEVERRDADCSDAPCVATELIQR